jgi:hypothetical protein
MTEENQRKLYEHFLRTGQAKRAEEVLKVYPQFKEPEPKETKSKKGK